MGEAWKGCCIYPNGKYSIFALLSALVSTTFGLISIGRCDFVQAYHLGYGLFSVEMEKEGGPDCEWWHSNAIEKFDGAWRAARVLGAMANTSGVICLCILLMTSCMKFSLRFFQVMSFMYTLCGILAIMTLIALSSDICENFTLGFVKKCAFNVSAGLSIVASLGYFLTAFFLSFLW
mmetsp:Transcript_26576/g.37433  ORF Transcript_26576/g.37433 Transcript_26576/m.37433 type:complete len:177 (+) Transcript_26576:70-600(+)